jgi:hypothetical protein
VQRQIDSALAGIDIIVETISPWKSIVGSQTLPSGTRNVRAGGPAASIEQTIGADRSGAGAACAFTALSFQQPFELAAVR